MSLDIVRQTMQYQDPRRTLLLNTHNKDNYGRHRGTVLYGLQITVTGSSTINIGPGALYSPFGTKVFVDVGSYYNLTVSNALLNTGIGSRPKVLGVVATFAKSGAGAIDPTMQPVLASRNDIGLATSPVLFNVQAIGYRQDTGVPTVKLGALDPIGMVALQDASFSFSTEATGGIQITDTSLASNEVLIGYIILGADPATGAAGVSLQQPGITVVQCKNLVEGVTDLLGADPLMGRNSTATEVYPANAALTQALTTGASSGHVPMPAPHFGGPDDFTQWINYKHPNFLRDGDNIVDALRRLDYILRLWMDRTGDQDLVNKVQDGVVSGLAARPTLDAIFAHFTGGTLTGTNANAITYEQPSDTSNLVLKDGTVLHALPSVVSTSVDTHKTALAALNRATWHMLKDVLGVSLSATEMRQNAAVDKTLNTSLQFATERAQSLLVTPTSSARADYLYTDALFAAVATLADRSRAGTSVNLLLNCNLARGALATPNNWTLSSATRSSAVGANGAFPGTVSVFSVAAGGFIQQSVALDATQSAVAIGDILSGNGRLGAALLYQTTAVTFTLEVETSDGTTVTGRWQVALPANAKFQHQSFVGRLDAAVASCRLVTFRLKNTGGGTAAINLIGTAMGLGAQAAGLTDPMTQQFMPRDGALAATADIDHGGFKGVNAAAGVAAGDLVNKAQLDAEAATRLANDNAEAATRLANDNAEAATRLANDNAEAATRLANDNAEAATRAALAVTVSHLVPINSRTQYTAPADYTFTVPGNVSLGLVYVGAVAGGGGGGGTDGGGSPPGGVGGTGEAQTRTLNTLAGDTIAIRVAGGGGIGVPAANSEGSTGGGGGGRTRVAHYRGATLLYEMILAGGGGGGGAVNTGYGPAHNGMPGGATGIAGTAHVSGPAGGTAGFGWPSGPSLAGGALSPYNGPTQGGYPGSSGSSSFPASSGSTVTPSVDSLFSHSLTGLSGVPTPSTSPNGTAGAPGSVMLLMALY